MPVNYRPWGCGSGSNGSCNDGWAQFEICEDDKTDKDYAQKAYDAAVKLTAWVCEQYGLDPHGTTKLNGVTVPVILCHWDSYLLGLGSGHDDIYDWLPKIIGKNMEDVRNDVADLLAKSKDGWVKVGDKWYYYENGTKAVGWKTINKKKYYFDADGTMHTGWFKDGKKWYYFDKSGSMAVGWRKDDDKWYYMDKNGVMQTKWIKDKGYWYYLDKSGAMQTGWLTLGKKVYYLHKTGEMASNEWIYDVDPNANNKGYYRIEKTGVFTYPYKAQWFHVQNDTKWKFKDSSGWYAKNCTIKIKGVNYKFDSNGFLIED
jgi:glucan-binding YG repeat protein